jgi:hypothetical protein
VKFVLILLKWLVLIVVAIGGTTLAFRRWVVSEASAVAKQEVKVFTAVRKTDMEHIDNRFDRLETLIQSMQK